MEIKVLKNIMDKNNKIAEENRKRFIDEGIFAVNVLASPGAGKTTLIIETIKILKGFKKIGVIEGDTSSTHDAEKIKSYVDDVVQINTGGSLLYFKTFSTTSIFIGSPFQNLNL